MDIYVNRTKKEKIAGIFTTIFYGTASLFTLFLFSVDTIISSFSNSVQNAIAPFFVAAFFISIISGIVVIIISKKKLARILALVYTLGLLLFVLTYLFVMQPHKIVGHSMETSLKDGTFILTSKLAYKSGNPQRGDLVIYRRPGMLQVDSIARVVGLPGEKISIKSNMVYINDKVLDEPYLASSIETLPGIYIKDQNITIPADNYAVMGDNRNYSSDSRDFGFVGIRSIIGKAFYIYAKANNIGPIANPYSK